MNGPLLPRRIMNRRSLRRTWLLSWYYVLPLLCLVLPAICWRYSTLLLHSAETPPVLTPLQQLRQLKASHLDQDVTGPSRSISSVDKQQLKAAALDPVDLSAQITAAQQYVDSIVNPKKRTAPKTWHYIFTPESYEMRAQYKKVSSCSAVLQHNQQQQLPTFDGAQVISSCGCSKQDYQCQAGGATCLTFTPTACIVHTTVSPCTGTGGSLHAPTMQPG